MHWHLPIAHLLPCRLDPRQRLILLGRTNEGILVYVTTALYDDEGHLGQAAKYIKPRVTGTKGVPSQTHSLLVS